MIKIIELENIALLSSHFDVLDADLLKTGGKLELSCEANINDDNDEADKVSMIATMKVKGINSDNSELFSIENKYISSFKTVDNEAFYETEETERVQFCLSLIYLSIREDVLSTLSKAGIKNLKLPFSLNAPFKKK